MVIYWFRAGHLHLVIGITTTTTANVVITCHYYSDHYYSDDQLCICMLRSIICGQTVVSIPHSLTPHLWLLEYDYDHCYYHYYYYYMKTQY
jgi:hypothetical protein